jgi:hypothetical protein
MDPQTIKIIQRLIEELVGIGILIWGLVFIYRGIAGKINFVMKGAGFSVKLANASPGVFLVFVGAVMMYLSMKDFSVERKTVSKEVDTTRVLEEWLQRAGSLKGYEAYTQTIDSIVGTDQTDRFKVSYITVYPPATLGQVGKEQYGDSRFWKLVAAENIGKGYFDWRSAGPETRVNGKSLLEIWHVSKYYGKTSEEVIKVSAASKKAGYEVLLQMARSRPQYNPQVHIQELTDMFRTQELGLVETPANYSGGIKTIGELSLKYYGDKALWPLIVWANPGYLSRIKSADDTFKQEPDIFILQFLP